MKKTLTVAIALSLSLTGCMNLAPSYERPDSANIIEQRWSKEAWVNESLKEQGIIPRRLGWREFFLDPRLQALIDAALTYNHDLRKAALNVQIVEQQHQISQAGKTPSLGLSGGAERKRSYGGRQSNNYQVGIGLSNYELDFFGRVKNQSDAALNKYLQTREARDAAQLSVINAVAKLYYQLRVAEELRTLAAKTLQSRKKTLALTTLRFQEGLAAGTDITSTQSLIANAQSSYEQQNRSVKKAQNALATLVGKPLTQIMLPEGVDLSQQFPNRAIFADLPADALLNRPDIRQAEYGLKAANANIGAARAEMYPKITLTGNLGYVSPELKTLFDSPTRIWGFGPSLSLPIFDRGQRRSNIKITELQKKIAVEDYQSTLQTAFQEVADALVTRETLAKQYQAERAGLSAAQNTLRLVKLQVQEGVANGLNLLDVERSDYAVRQGLLATQLQMMTNNVDLYTTLGGGLHATSAMINAPESFPEAQETRLSQQAKNSLVKPTPADKAVIKLGNAPINASLRTAQ